MAEATLLTLPEGAIIAHDFRIVRLLGAGGMGAVYLATQLSTGKPRALKVLRPDLAPDESLRARFTLEARVGSMIESDHVVEVIAAGVDDATQAPYLVMELLEGQTLQERLDELGTLPFDEVVHIFEQLGHALEAAHAKGVVHRDLKPDNIFLSRPRVTARGCVVKVLDFGVAKLVGAAMATQTGQVGTPTYMSPEQCRGGEISAATDVWALGLIAFKMLTGMTYWRAANRDEVSAVPLMFEITFEPIVAASARAAELGRPGLIPPKFDAWFSHCLARDAAARFTEGGEAARALMSVLELGEAAPIEMIAESAAPSGVVTERAASSALRANIDERSLAPVADPVTPTPRIYASPARAAISGTEATVAAPFGKPARPSRSGLTTLFAAGAVTVAVVAVAAWFVAFRAAPSGAASAAASAVALDPCRDGATLVPGGTYARNPGDEVTVATLCLDLNEVTIADYEKCVAADRCKPAASTVSVPGSKDEEKGWRNLFCPGARLGSNPNFPVTCVDANMAVAYCAWRGARLPTDGEFQWAARGGANGFRYPWGKEDPTDAHMCTSLRDETRGWRDRYGAWQDWARPLVPGASVGACEVGARRAGASPWGVNDLLGNAWEWVTVEKAGTKTFALAGSSWNTGTATYINAAGVWNPGWPAEARQSDVGFRCASAPKR